MMKRKQNELSKAPTSISLSDKDVLRRQHVEARRRLPVAKFRSELCSLVKENDVVLVIAETVSIDDEKIPYITPIERTEIP